MELDSTLINKRSFNLSINFLIALTNKKELIKELVFVKNKLSNLSIKDLLVIDKPYHKYNEFIKSFINKLDLGIYKLEEVQTQIQEGIKEPNVSLPLYRKNLILYQTNYKKYSAWKTAKKLDKIFWEELEDFFRRMDFYRIVDHSRKEYYNWWESLSGNTSHDYYDPLIDF